MTSQDRAAPPQGGIGVTAQISLYPLSQADLAPAIEAVLGVLRDHGLPLEVGSMSTLTWGDHGAVCAALRDAFAAAVEHGPAVLQVTLSNACPLPTPPEGGHHD